MSALIEMGKALCLPWHKLARIKYSASIKVFQFFLIVVPIYVSIGSWVSNYTEGMVKLPVPVNFLWLYFAGFMFFLGGTIFDMFCPNIVRTNRSFPAYYKDTQLLSLEIVSKYMDISKRKRDALNSALDSASTAQDDEDNIEAYIDDWMQESNKLENLWHTREQWVNENHNGKKVARFANTAFYYIGFIVLFILTAYDAPRRIFQGLGVFG